MSQSPAAPCIDSSPSLHFTFKPCRCHILQCILANHTLIIKCVFVWVARCKRSLRPFSEPVGVRQRHHSADGPRIQGPQLSGLPAVLRGNAVTNPQRFQSISSFSLHVCLFFFIFLPVVSIQPVLAPSTVLNRQTIEGGGTCFVFFTNQLFGLLLFLQQFYKQGVDTCLFVMQQ